MGDSASSPREVAEIELLKARAAAARERAAADTTRAAADAAATRERAAADSKRAWADTMRSWVVVAASAVPLAFVAALATDFYFHEEPSRIRRRVLDTLRLGRLPPTVPIVRPSLLPVPQAPMTVDFLPSMLLGPTGCGKSTLLAEIAREASSSAPTVLVRLRLPTSEGGKGAGASIAHSKQLMDSAAAQFYEQIGFPRRRSIVGSILGRGFEYFGQRSQVELDEIGALKAGVPALLALSTRFSPCVSSCIESAWRRASLCSRPRR